MKGLELMPYFMPLVVAALFTVPINTGDKAARPFTCSGAVRGTAFVDTNGNGVRDPGEPPLSGVTVTLERTDTGLPAFGSVQKTSNFTTMMTPQYNGRGITYNGTNYWISHDSQPMIYKLNPVTLAVMASVSTAPWAPAALTWDPNRLRIWTIGAKVPNQGNTPWRIWAIDPATGLEVPGSAMPLPSQLVNPDGFQYDRRTDTFWSGNDQAGIVYHLNMAGAVIGSFATPMAALYGKTGIAFDGCNLWLASMDHATAYQTRMMMVSDTGALLTYFDYSLPSENFGGEDIEVDATSAAPDVLLWAHSAGAAPKRLKAFSIGRTVRTTQTDVNGAFVFANVLPGQYQVKQQTMLAYTFSLPVGGVHVNVPVGNSVVTNQDFGNKRRSSRTGSKQ